MKYMSLLPNDTFVNSGRALWAVAGSGGGGGGGSTLQSPASITPDVGGNAQLGVISGGTGVTSLNVSSPTQSVLAVNGTTSSDIILGTNFHIKSSAPSVVTFSGAGTQVNPVATFDALGNNVALSAPGLPGSVQTGNPLIVASYANQQTDVGISPIAPLTLNAVTYSGSSEISNTIATSGSLALASSQASLSNIIVADQAGVASTFIKGLGGAPQTLLATVASVASGYTVTMPAPTGEGLYCIMVGSTPTSNQASRDAQLVTMAYVNTAGRIQIGGNGSTTTLGGGILDIYPLDSTTSLFLQYTGTGQGLLNISVVAFKISGPIPGTF